MRDLALLSLFKSCAAVEYCLEYREKEVERELIGLEQDLFFKKVKEIIYNILRESDLDNCARTFNLHPNFLYQMIARKAIGKCKKEKEIVSDNYQEGFGRERKFRIGRKVDLSECKAIYSSRSLRSRQKHTQSKHPSQWPSVSKIPLSQNLSPNLEIKPPSNILKKALSLLPDLR